MLTDSGGFQIFSLADTLELDADGVNFRSIVDGSRHRWTPEDNMRVQEAIGADIIMQLDQCTHYPATCLLYTSASSTSTVGMLTKDFGLSTSQAATVIDIADQLGVDTDDPAAVSGFVAKNIGNKDEIQDIAAMYQAGEISESQAKSMLKGIVNV